MKNNHIFIQNFVLNLISVFFIFPYNICNSGFVTVLRRNLYNLESWNGLQMQVFLVNNLFRKPWLQLKYLSFQWLIIAAVLPHTEPPSPTCHRKSLGLKSKIMMMMMMSTSLCLILAKHRIPYKMLHAWLERLIMGK